MLAVLFVAISASAAVLPGGVRGDGQTSIEYDANTGEIAVDSPGFTPLTSIQIQSESCSLTGQAAMNLGGSFDIDTDCQIFKFDPPGFVSLSFGNVAATGLSQAFVLSDFSVDGALSGGGTLGNVDLIYTAVAAPLQPGDADQDLDVDQFDLIQAFQAGKYEMGPLADWSEGDWSGAPGGRAGSPPPGDGEFNSSDLVDVFVAGFYVTGPYATDGTGLQGIDFGEGQAILANGVIGDGKTSLVYDANTGELALDSLGLALTSLNIDSFASVFTADAALNLPGSFDIDADESLFKLGTAGFDQLSFGNVMPSGLSESFVLADLTVFGSLQGSGGLGPVDLVYIPAPTTAALQLAAIGIVGLLARSRRRAYQSFR